MLDELVIFFSVLITKRTKKFYTRQGRFLKLFSVLIMLAFEFIILIRPELMNNLLILIVNFADVFATSFLIIHLKHRLEG
jgi:hypothetical protein